MSDIHQIILFGASGDLARKMLLPALYRLEERGVIDQHIVGVALDPWDAPRFREHVSGAISEAIDDVDAEVEKRLLARLDFVAGDYTDAETYRRLHACIGAPSGCLHYLAIPPVMFETVVSGLGGVGLLDDSRAMVEKPFGRDLDSARELNGVLHRFLDETAIYRIDHFLGKEPVENLLAFRYANPIFDAVLNRHYVDHIQITMAESFDIGSRGALYETLGVVRDVVQNHLLQVVCLLTMEAPITPDADSFADERAKVLKATRTVPSDAVVYGQYRGYRSADRVSKDSTVATFVALPLAVETPRWYGVPIFLRAGKALAVTCTEARVVFQESPPLSFSATGTVPEANQLVFRIGPADGVDLMVQTKLPGDGIQLVTTPLTVDYDNIFGRIPLAYERVLGDALDGNRSQFGREDEVEEAWRIVDGILDPGSAPTAYQQGGWGPAAARDVPSAGRRWTDPAPRGDRQ